MTRIRKTGRRSEGGEIKEAERSAVPRSTAVVLYCTARGIRWYGSSTSDRRRERDLVGYEGGKSRVEDLVFSSRFKSFVFCLFSFPFSLLAFGFVYFAFCVFPFSFFGFLFSLLSLVFTFLHFSSTGPVWMWTWVWSCV